jgi:hypothetical protein
MSHAEVIKGVKTGGRGAGTPNRFTAEIQHKLEALKRLDKSRWHASRTPEQDNQQ